MEAASSVAEDFSDLEIVGARALPRGSPSRAESKGGRRRGAFGSDDDEPSGRYATCEKAGEGAFGSVYRAIDNETGAEVALKRIRVKDKRAVPVRAHARRPRKDGLPKLSASCA